MSVAGRSDSHDGDEPTAIATPRIKNDARRAYDPLSTLTPPPVRAIVPAGLASEDEEDDGNFEGDDPPTTAEPLDEHHHLRLGSPTADEAFGEDAHPTMIDPQVLGDERSTMDLGPAARSALEVMPSVGGPRGSEKATMPVSPAAINARFDDAARTVRWESERGDPATTKPFGRDATADAAEAARHQALADQPTRLTPRSSSTSGPQRSIPRSSPPPRPLTPSAPPPFVARHNAPTAPPPFRGGPSSPPPGPVGPPLPLPAPANSGPFPQQGSGGYPAPPPQTSFAPPSPAHQDPMRAISMKPPGEAAPAPVRHLPPVQLRAMSDVVQTPRHGTGHLAPPHDPRDARSRRIQDLVIWGSVVVITASLVTLLIWFLAR